MRALLLHIEMSSVKRVFFSFLFSFCCWNGLVLLHTTQLNFAIVYIASLNSITSFNLALKSSLIIIKRRNL